MRRQVDLSLHAHMVLRRMIRSLLSDVILVLIHSNIQIITHIHLLLRLLRPSHPIAPLRELKLANRLLLELDAVSLPALRRHVVPPLVVNRARKLEVLVQMVHILQHVPLHAARHCDVVDQTQVDDVLAQAHAAGVRADDDAELGGHEEDGEDLGDAGETAGVDLADVDRVGLQELLEDHAVVRVLAGCDADAVGLQRLSDGCVPEDIIGCCGLFDEPMRMVLACMWEGIAGEGRV